MIKIKMLDTNKIVEVTANVAHGLVEEGKATRVADWYQTREMKTSPTVSIKRDEKVSTHKSRRSSSKTYKSK